MIKPSIGDIVIVVSDLNAKVQFDYTLFGYVVGSHDYYDRDNNDERFADS